MLFQLPGKSNRGAQPRDQCYADPHIVTQACDTDAHSSSLDKVDVLAGESLLDTLLAGLHDNDPNDPVRCLDEFNVLSANEEAALGKDFDFLLSATSSDAIPFDSQLDAPASCDSAQMSDSVGSSLDSTLSSSPIDSFDSWDAFATSASDSGCDDLMWNPAQEHNSFSLVL